VLGMARGATAWGSAMDHKAQLLQQVNVSGEDDRPLTFGPEQAGCSCGCIRAPTAVHHRNLSPQTSQAQPSPRRRTISSLARSPPAASSMMWCATSLSPVVDPLSTLKCLLRAANCRKLRCRGRGAELRAGDDGERGNAGIRPKRSRTAKRAGWLVSRHSMVIIVGLTLSGCQQVRHPQRRFVTACKCQRNGCLKCRPSRGGIQT
jgi:hypothetical protein